MFIEPDLQPYIIGFERIISGIEAPPEMLSKLRDIYISEFAWGPKKRRIEEVVMLAMPFDGWRWHWYEKWQARFETLGALPKMWQSKREVWSEIDRETVTPDRRRALLASSLLGAGRIERDFLPKYRDKWCHFFNPMLDEHPHIRQLEFDLIAEYRDGKGAANPTPFYPGSRLGMSMGKLDADRLSMGINCRVRRRLCDGTTHDSD